MLKRGRPIRVYARIYQAASWLVVVAYLGQAVFAGQFLSGTYFALRLHQYGGTVSDVVVFLAAFVGALLRWHGKGNAWPFWVAVGLLVTNQVQNGAGAARLISLHIPLGASMLAVAVAAALTALQIGRLTGKHDATGTTGMRETELQQ
jgi:hypothetical protein